MHWYIEALKKYFDFSGRSRRREFWLFYLFFLIINIVLVIIEQALGMRSSVSGIGFLSTVYSLLLLIPSISVTVRRLHDTGRTGWWILIGLIPLIGGIVLLVFMLLDSQPEANEYGPNPKSA
jgi:uncharacterized membrane protein YhaH (DUF805 family)